MTDRATTSAARRARAYRRRQRSGLAVLRVTVDEVALAHELIEAGLLPAADADDRAALAAALGQFIARTVRARHA